MALPLFEEIYDDAYLCDRTSPASIEDFVRFGLQPEDYVRYVALQQSVQSELLLYGYLQSEIHTPDHNLSRITYPTLDRLLAFCKEKNLISSDAHRLFLCLQDAEYHHNWLRYPKTNEEFRLLVERKLSPRWDPAQAYLFEKFDYITFDYGEYPDGTLLTEPDSLVHIKRYNSQNRTFTYLSKSEVADLLAEINADKLSLAQELEHHLSLMPEGHDTSAVSSGLPWVKRAYALSDRLDAIEDAYGEISEAAKTPDIYQFRENDTLTVYCGEDTCKNEHHLLSNMKVEFRFYEKPSKCYVLQRCAHCAKFRISLSELTKMFENQGVPRGKIVYEGVPEGDFSDFPETSIFYNMGYTVSQSVGLSAEERRKILLSAIETGKASKHQVLSFLSQRMNINGMKMGNEAAFRKWKEDYNFIQNT